MYYLEPERSYGRILPLMLHTDPLHCRQLLPEQTKAFLVAPVVIDAPASRCVGRLSPAPERGKQRACRPHPSVHTAQVLAG